MDKNKYNRLVRDPYTWYRAGQNMQFVANKTLKLWQKALDSPQIIAVDFNNPKSRAACYDILTSRGELFHTYMMLMGYAIENITKGLEVCLKMKDKNSKIQKPVYVLKDIDLSYHDIHLHHLKHVVKSLNIDLDKNERDAAKLAVDHVLWVGKYPVPVNSDVQDYSNTNIREYQKYAVILDSLFLRLEKRLGEEIGLLGIT